MAGIRVRVLLGPPFLPRFVQEWLSRDDGDPYDVLRYDLLDRRLTGLVGPERVQYLPLHDYGSPSHWRHFTSGTCLDPERLAEWHAAAPQPVNVTREGDGWQARPRPRLRARLTRELPPESRLRRAILHPWNLPMRALSLATWRPAPSFRLTADLQDEILDRYGASNRRFADRTGLALEGHAYW